MGTLFMTRRAFAKASAVTIAAAGVAGIGGQALAEQEGGIVDGLGRGEAHPIMLPRLRQNGMRRVDYRQRRSRHQVGR
mgnify:CR=1 FL=1